MNIAVIMPVRNPGEMLNDALLSLCCQTVKPKIVIVVDDFSECPEFIRNSIQQVRDIFLDIDFSLLRNAEHLGITKSLNRALELIPDECEFIARQDSDDISLPERFERFSEQMKRRPEIDFYSTAYWDHDLSTARLSLRPKFFRRLGMNLDMLKSHNPLCHGTLITRSKVLKKLRYDEDYKFSQDYDLYFRLYQGNYSFFYDTAPTYIDQNHQGRVSVKNSHEQIRCFKKIRQKYAGGSFFPANRFFFLLQDIYHLIKKICCKFKCQKKH